MNSVVAVNPDIGLAVSVSLPGGHRESFVVDSHRAIIGSAPHCEVRLPQELVSREHARLSVERGVIHLVSVVGPGNFLIGGTPFRGGPILDGSEVDVGNGVSIQVRVAALGNSGKSRFPLEYLALIPAAAAALLTLLASPAAISQMLPLAPPAAELFDSVPAACPVSVMEAGHLAQQLEAFAEGRSERAPFAPVDGITAVSDYQKAASCYRAASDEAGARRALGAAEAASTKLKEEYLMRRTRLEHAADIADFNGIRRELPYVRALAGHRPGPYLDWILCVDRAQQKQKESSGKLL